MIDWRKWFGPKDAPVLTDPAFDPEPKTADLVAELRRWGSVKVGTPFTGNDWGPPLTKLLNDAADEIESLRNEPW